MNDILNEIKNRIQKHGHHRYIVKQGIVPRYTYTIGLNDQFGFELVMSGSMAFETNKELEIIFNNIIQALLKNKNEKEFSIEYLGNFELKKVHPSWIKLMMLGAIDFYGTENINAFQIISTDIKNLTIETPMMSKAWDGKDLIWRYLSDDIHWPYNVPKNSVAITNLKALLGVRLTEFYRFEEDEWEIFSGNGALEPKEMIRIVPLSVLLAADPTLIDFVNEAVGFGKYRDSKDENNSTWYNWE